MLNQDLRHLTLSAAANVLAGLILVALLAQLWGRFAGMPPEYQARALLLFAAFGLAVFPLLPQHLPCRRFGPANGVTLLRAVSVALLAGFVGSPEAINAHAWLICTAATAALLLDGVDGWLARRSNTATAFGARFDMETDALFILVLALLLWHSGKLGAWTVTAGIIRYLFVAAGWFWPRLRAPLPPSRRRKTVCVVLVIALIGCLSPVVDPAPGTLIMAAALGLLLYSFAIDIRWLLRRPVHSPTGVSS